MKTLKDLVLAASEKVVMNEVSNIKEIYPDSTVFESIEEFEAHVVDRAIEYLSDNYPDEEEYTSGTWMLSTACNCEGDWIFLIDGEYYLMDYCDWDNEEVDKVQVYIWDNNIEEFASRIAEELNVKTEVEITNPILDGEKLTISTIIVTKNKDNTDDEENIIIGTFANGQPLQVSQEFLNPISDEEFGNWDCNKINTNIEELILSIECSAFGLSNYNTGNFNNSKYNIAPELIGKMNFMYDVNMVSPYYDRSIWLKVTDNNDGTVSIGLGK
ncbi:hypothetical protein ACIXGO_04820 [Bacteroides fragilis]|jgi:hypothetical protein|nr:MAG TPA: hypothetical protein [Caudoviricetes sp.]